MSGRINRLKSLFKSRSVWETSPEFSEGYRPLWLSDEQVRECKQSDANECDPSPVSPPGKVYVADDPVEVYKAVREGIATLRIPRGARVVVSAEGAGYYRGDLTGGKMRTDVAYVERVENLTGDSLRKGTSIWSAKINLSLCDAFQYHPGAWVETELDENTGTSCSDGIHFFASKAGARDWWDAMFA
jgi:hypothetical protein